MPVSTPESLHGALLPVLRQIVQHLAGILLGAGVINENMATAIAGLIMALITMVWMLVAWAQRAKKPPAP